MRIELSFAAERDLRELRSHLAADNPEAAEIVTGRLVKAFLLLREQPDIGRPGVIGATREWSVPGLPYVIPYQVKSGTLFILRVWHTSRDRPQSW